AGGDAPQLHPDDVTRLWTALLDADAVVSGHGSAPVDRPAPGGAGPDSDAGTHGGAGSDGDAVAEGGAGPDGGAGNGARPFSSVLPDATKAAAITHLSPDQVRRAVTAARWHAESAGRPIGPDDVLLGTRAQNAAGLERLARRVEPGVGWDDIVLLPRPRLLLRELVARARLRDQVLDGWGMRQGGGRGGGISALFAGPPGTGKTMAAEVVAHELGFDLYTVNLATVVDKYIGQTEKNLERIFSEAEQVNGVLFFDEADALFGKRSDVRDAHDRYANVETAYLLQRMEAFDGIAILATNLRANLDDAFSRRLDGLIDFQPPDAAHRRLIWERQLRPGVPRAPDVNLTAMAERFELSGGDIRNIALSASYFAAEEGRPVSMIDLFRGTIREYLKLGRLCRESDFLPYPELLLQ
ncbi:MAG TPA: AAA family ATPase, partial [Kineosporiaceae bacterium]|nr:AAA family ATPase [Kineosporiaceae bacterium]